MVRASRKARFLFAILSVTMVAAGTLFWRFNLPKADHGLEQARVPHHPSRTQPEEATAPRISGAGDGPLAVTWRAAEKRPASRSVPTAQVDCSHLRLLGTVSGDANTPRAIIEDRRLLTQNLYRVGDPVCGGRVVDISKEWVMIRFEDRDLVLAMGERPTVKDFLSKAGVDSDHILVGIDRQETGELFKKISKLMPQVHLRPRVFYDGTAGLELAGIENGSFLEQLGLRNGDIIQAVDGTKITRPQKMAYLYNQLASVLPAIPLPLQTLGIEIGRAIGFIDKRSSGIIKEVYGFFQKIEAGSDIHLLVLRRGKQCAITYEMN